MLLTKSEREGEGHKKGLDSETWVTMFIQDLE